jgi:hypothetical protein
VSEGGPGAGAALGLLVTAAAVGGLGYAAYAAVDGELAGKWIYVAAAAGLALAQLAAFAGSVSPVTRGVASVAYVIGAIAAAALWLGVDGDGVTLAFGVSLEAALRWGLAAMVAAGAIALPAFPSSAPGRVAGAALALAVVAPWAAGLWNGAPPETILTGAGRFYEPWPRWAQPALVGGLLSLLVMLLAGIAILGGKKRAEQRILALCALVIPLLAAAVMLKYAAAGAPAGDAARAPDTAEPPAAIADAAPSELEAGRDDCRGVIDPDADVSAIRAGFDGDSWRRSAIAFLEARYPDAAWMIGTLRDPDHFDVWFEGKTDSWGAVMMALGTGVHESAHMAGLQTRRGARHRFIVGRDDILEVPVPRTFDRSEIAARLPPEIRALSYTSTYLEGDSGAQGFEMILEELNAYTYSLYVAIITAGEMPRGMSVSGRDGLLTLMVYTEAYLARAREQVPATYEAITSAPELVAATIRLYDRAACVIELSGDDRRIGIDDEMLREHALGDKRLGEIDRLR